MKCKKTMLKRFTLKISLFSRSTHPYACFYFSSWNEVIRDHHESIRLLYSDSSSFYLRSLRICQSSTQRDNLEKMKNAWGSRACKLTVPLYKSAKPVRHSKRSAKTLKACHFTNCKNCSNYNYAPCKKKKRTIASLIVDFWDNDEHFYI